MRRLFAPLSPRASLWAVLLFPLAGSGAPLLLLNERFGLHIYVDRAGPVDRDGLAAIRAVGVHFEVKFQESGFLLLGRLAACHHQQRDQGEQIEIEPAGSRVHILLRNEIASGK